jgi:hypothetical protein
VPVEGQWQRARTPLSRRDRRLLAAAAVLGAIAVAVLAVVYLTRSSSASSEGCLVANVPSTMGGAQLRICGGAAHAFCRSHAGDITIAAACRRQGFAADLRR